LSTKKYNSRLAALELEFEPWKNIYKDIRDNLVPFAGYFPEDHNGPYDVSLNDKRFNTDVTRAVRVFGAGMYSGMCSPSRPWIQLGMEDQDLNDYGPVKVWLEYMEKLYLNTFARSNFYGVQKTNMEDQGWSGTGLYLPEAIPGPPWVFFHYFPVGSYRLAEDTQGKTDTIYRRFKMEARNIVRYFGADKVSDTVKRAAENNPFTKFDIVHAIEPRDDSDREYGRIDARNMPWKSCYYEVGKDALLRESGFKRFPGVASKFMDVGGFPYGAGPGIDAIKQIKMLHQMEKDGLVGLHREVRPPLAIPSRFENTIDLTPDGLNFGLDGDKGSIGPIIQTSINWQQFQYRLDKVSYSVDRAFMVDLFLMILNQGDNDPRRTATEILKKHEEKLTVIGPAVENQMYRNFDPCIDMMFDIFLDVPGLVPPPPAEIQGQSLRVKYTSILAQAQRLSEVSKIHTYLDVASRVAEIDQGSVMATNSFKLLQATEDAIGLPPNIVRSTDEYEAIMEQQRQAAAQAQQAAQMEAVAGAAGKLGGAKVEGTALGELKEQLAQ
jgi:hypothetical protein